jgi:hypothetical protein
MNEALWQSTAALLHKRMTIRGTISSTPPIGITETSFLSRVLYASVRLPPPATANTAGAPMAASEAMLPLRSISPVDGVPFEPNALLCCRRIPYP